MYPSDKKDPELFRVFYCLSYMYTVLGRFNSGIFP
jgi:hypothetical protein